METEKKITEQPSHFDHLERMTAGELLRHINEEDHRVAESVKLAIRPWWKPSNPECDGAAGFSTWVPEQAGGWVCWMPASCHPPSECPIRG